MRCAPTVVQKTAIDPTEVFQVILSAAKLALIPGGKAMLASFGPRSKEARAHELRLELEDVLKRLPRLDDEAGLALSHHLAETAREARETYGPFETIAAETKVEIARRLILQAKERFDQDPAQAYACFILSALYEADGLPGEDAAFVKTTCAEYVLAAIAEARGRES
jgi:hypothetical protein